MFKIFRILKRTHNEPFIAILTMIAKTFQFLVVSGILIYLTEFVGHTLQRAVLPANTSLETPPVASTSQESI